MKAENCLAIWLLDQAKQGKPAQRGTQLWACRLWRRETSSSQDWAHTSPTKVTVYSFTCEVHSQCCPILSAKFLLFLRRSSGPMKPLPVVLPQPSAPSSCDFWLQIRRNTWHVSLFLTLTLQTALFAPPHCGMCPNFLSLKD